MRPMTAHEKECALTAAAAKIEKAQTTKERKEWRAFFREVAKAPIEAE